MDQNSAVSSGGHPTPYNAFMNSLQQDIDRLTLFLVDHPRLAVLTGAGVSFASGIPTYRDQHGNWLHRAPVQEQSFLKEEDTRRRYWARSLHGWPIMRDAQPNATHLALAKLEEYRRIELLITQNVDRLHQRAGSRNVIDLHGRVDRVRCLVCSAVHSRDSVQKILERENSSPSPSRPTLRPDGDMDVAEETILQLVLPRCHLCAGDLMPDVVFFGGTVPAARVNTCLDALERADALLAIGSSLMVFSGYRFCRRARQLGKPIAIINPGTTRADDLAELKLCSDAHPLLTRSVATLGQDFSHSPYVRDNPS
jgi:NAD-dependent SIR2 family protein deacetylase